MKNKLIILFSIAVGIAIFSFIIKPEAGFNMIAYLFFQLLLVNKGRPQADENTFILIFDGLFSMVIAYCLFRFLKEMTK